MTCFVQYYSITDDIITNMQIRFKYFETPCLCSTWCAFIYTNSRLTEPRHRWWQLYLCVDFKAGDTEAISVKPQMPK